MASTAFLIVLPTKAQQIDPTLVKTFLPFEGNLNDASDNPVTYALSANPLAIRPVTYAAGKFGQAGIFDSTAIVSSNFNFNTSSTFTVSAWVLVKALPTITGKTMTFIHQKDEGKKKGRVHLEVKKIVFNAEVKADSSDMFGTFSDGGTVNDPRTGEFAIAVDTWYHVASVKGPDKTRILYVNGIEVINTTITQNTTDNTAEHVIGANKNENDGFVNAYIDELLITTEVLTPEQILYVKENGVAKALMPTSVRDLSSDNTVIYYSNGNLNINTTVIANNSDVKVFSLTGKLMYHNTMSLENGSNSFSLNLNRGLYIIKISTEKGEIAQKIVL